MDFDRRNLVPKALLLISPMQIPYLFVPMALAFLKTIIAAFSSPNYQIVHFLHCFNLIFILFEYKILLKLRHNYVVAYIVMILKFVGQMYEPINFKYSTNQLLGYRHNADKFFASMYTNGPIPKRILVLL